MNIKQAWSHIVGIVGITLALSIIPSTLAQPVSGSSVRSIDWNATDTLLAVAYSDGNVRVFDTDGQEVTYFEGGFSVAASWHPLNPMQLLLSSLEQRARIIDVATGSVVANFGSERYWTYDSIFSPDGTKVALGLSNTTNSSSQSGLIQIYSVTTGELLVETGQTLNAVLSIEWSPDGLRIVANRAGYLTILDALTGDVIKYLPEFDENGEPLGAGSAHEVWSEDSDVLTTTSGVWVDFWETETYGVFLTPVFTEDHPLLASVFPLSGGINDLSWRPNSNTVAVAGRDGVKLVNAVSRNIKDTPIITEARAVAWNSDGSKLAYDQPYGTFEIASIPLNQPPIANAGPDQTVVAQNGTGAVTLDGSGSSDPDGTLVSYSWRVNDVEIATGINPQVNLAIGTHTITLTVTDDDGATATDEVIITLLLPDGF